MPVKSKFRIDIPKTDLLTYTLNPGDKSNGQNEVLWINADSPDISLTRSQALRWAASLATGLNRLGIRKGDVILFLTPNQIYVPVAFIGVIAYGAIYTAASASAVPDEVARQITQTQAKLVLVHPRLAATATEAARLNGFPRDRIFLLSDNPSQSGGDLKDISTIFGDESAVNKWQWPQYDERACRRDVAVINFSSGTTGMPKGVCLSQANFIANCEQAIFIRYLGRPSAARVASTSERWLGLLPFSHAFAQNIKAVMACRLRVPVITDFTTAPPVILMLSRRPETRNYKLGSLKDIVAGAAPLSKELQDEVMQQLSVNIRQTFGGTELTCSSHGAPGGMRDGLGSVGYLYPNMECKLLNEHGKEVATGESGEAYLRGPNVCLGYWQNPKATSAVIDKEGFYRTGDICVQDDRGFYYIIDRVKELIKVNGLQIAPAEMEALLLQHPAVADTAVVSVKRGMEEFPRAYIVLKDDANTTVSEPSIATWVAERVAKHKKLTGGVVFVEQIPKNPTGKIQRNIIRGWAAEGNGSAVKAHL